MTHSSLPQALFWQLNALLALQQSKQTTIDLIGFAAWLTASLSLSHTHENANTVYMYSNRSVSQRSLLDLHSVYNLFNSKYLDKWSACFQSPDYTRWKAQCSRTCSFKYRANEQAAAVFLQTCEGRSHTIQLTLSYCCHKRICNAIFQRVWKSLLILLFSQISSILLLLV